jgi:phospholipase C
MKLTSITAATLLFAASFSDALPTQNKATTVNRLSGLEKIKHIVYFMQVKLSSSKNF